MSAEIIGPGSPPTSISDPIAGRFIAETAQQLGIRFHTSPDNEMPPPGDLPPSVKPYWIQVWSRDDQKWLAMVKSYDAFQDLKPGDLVACFDNIDDPEPTEFILVLSDPKYPDDLRLLGVSMLSLPVLKETPAFAEGLGEVAN